MKKKLFEWAFGVAAWVVLYLVRDTSPVTNINRVSKIVEAGITLLPIVLAVDVAGFIFRRKK